MVKEYCSKCKKVIKAYLPQVPTIKEMQIKGIDKTIKKMSRYIDVKLNKKCPKCYKNFYHI